MEDICIGVLIYLVFFWVFRKNCKDDLKVLYGFLWLDIIYYVFFLIYYYERKECSENMYKYYCKYNLISLF